MTRFNRFLDDRRGAAAAEFAMILPGLLFLIFGIINMCLVMYAMVNLHAAVEGAARYAVTFSNTNPNDTTTLQSSCGTSGSVCQYVIHHYKGPALGLTVACTPATCTSSGCGYTVTATGSYKVSYGLGAVTVPLVAKACFS